MGVMVFKIRDLVCEGPSGCPMRKASVPSPAHLIPPYFQESLLIHHVPREIHAFQREMGVEK